MKLKLQKLWGVALVLIILFCAGFTLRNFPFSGGDFDKEVTPLMTANDAMYFIWRTKESFDTEMPVLEPPYVSYGTENVISLYPPLMYTFMASLTKLTNISPYQMAYVLISLLSMLIPLYGFIIVRKYFNLETALIAFLLSAFVATTLLFQVYIGFWADIFSFAVIIASFFFLKELWKERSYPVLFVVAVLCSAALVGHMWEFKYFGFLALMTFVMFVFKKINKKALGNIAIIVLLIGLITAVFFTRYNALGRDTGVVLDFGVKREVPAYFPKVEFNMFLIAGTLAGLAAIISKLTKSKLTIYQITIITLPVFIVLFALGRNIGVEPLHTYRQLYHGYFFLVVPTAIGAAWILEMSKKRIDKWMYVVVWVIIIIALLTPYKQTFNQLKSMKHNTMGKMAEWESLMWIRDMTPKDSKALMLWGNYGQGFDIYAERITYYDVSLDHLREICNKTLPEKFYGSWKINALTPDGFRILEKTGAVSIMEPDIPDQNAGIPLDTFDYILLRYKGTQIDQCMGYYINEMQNLGHKVAWNNEYIAIIEVSHDE